MLRLSKFELKEIPSIEDVDLVKAISAYTGIPEAELWNCNFKLDIEPKRDFGSSLNRLNVSRKDVRQASPDDRINLQININAVTVNNIETANVFLPYTKTPRLREIGSDIRNPSIPIYFDYTCNRCSAKMSSDKKPAYCFKCGRYGTFKLDWLNSKS